MALSDTKLVFTDGGKRTRSRQTGNFYPESLQSGERERDRERDRDRDRDREREREKRFHTEDKNM